MKTDQFIARLEKQFPGLTVDQDGEEITKDENGKVVSITIRHSHGVSHWAPAREDAPRDEHDRFAYDGAPEREPFV